MLMKKQYHVGSIMRHRQLLQQPGRINDKREYSGLQKKKCLHFIKGWNNHVAKSYIFQKDFTGNFLSIISFEYKEHTYQLIQ
jgi:hypothetical protein